MSLVHASFVKAGTFSQPPSAVSWDRTRTRRLIRPLLRPIELRRRNTQDATTWDFICVLTRTMQALSLRAASHSRMLCSDFHYVCFCCQRLNPINVIPYPYDAGVAVGRLRPVAASIHRIPARCHLLVSSLSAYPDHGAGQHVSPGWPVCTSLR